jgi:sugar lactone lactonase YvrE
MKTTSQYHPRLGWAVRASMTAAILLATLGVEQSVAALLPGEARLVLVLPEENEPEGIAVDDDGTIYLSNRYETDGGRASEILRLGDDGRLEVFATFGTTDVPGANGILGLAICDGDVYAALATRVDATHGLWKISRNGQSSVRLPGSEQMVFPNALTFDHEGRLYVTDSTGAIWRFRPEDRGEPGIVWAVHELFAPFADFDPIVLPVGEELVPLPLPGANGIAFVPPHHLYVANTERGLLLRLAIQADGSAGELEVAAGDSLNPYTPLLTIDGIAADAQGRIHAVVPGFPILGLFGVPAASPLVMFDPASDELSFTVTDPAVAFGFLHTPLSLSAGRLPGDESTVFVANSGLFADLIPGPGPGIAQVGLNP